MAESGADKRIFAGITASSDAYDSQDTQGCRAAMFCDTYLPGSFPSPAEAKRDLNAFCGGFIVLGLVLV